MVSAKQVSRWRPAFRQQAITLTAPPHPRQISMSILNNIR